MKAHAFESELGTVRDLLAVADGIIAMDTIKKEEGQ